MPRNRYMKKHIALFALGFLVSMNSSFAIANEFGRSTDACLRRSEIRDLRTASDFQSLIVQDSARKIYRVRLDGPCYFLSQKLAVRFVDFAQNRLACLERGDGITKVNDFGRAPRCKIESIEYFHPGPPVAGTHPAG